MVLWKKNIFEKKINGMRDPPTLMANVIEDFHIFLKSSLLKSMAMEVLIRIATIDTFIWWASQARVEINIPLINFFDKMELGDSWYLSPPPPPAVVYFFQAGALFCRENAKFGGGALKVTNIRNGIGDISLNWRHDREPSGRSLESSTRDRTTSLLCGSGSQDSTHFVQIVLLPILSPGQWSQARITRFNPLLSNWQLSNCPSFKSSALEM